MCSLAHPFCTELYMCVFECVACVSACTPCVCESLRYITYANVAYVLQLPMCVCVVFNMFVTIIAGMRGWRISGACFVRCCVVLGGGDDDDDVVAHRLVSAGLGRWSR